MRTCVLACLRLCLCVPACVPSLVWLRWDFHGVGVAGFCPGRYHAVVCTSSGNVFTWGFSALGQLGHGDLVDRPSPARVLGSDLLTGSSSVTATSGDSTTTTSSLSSSTYPSSSSSSSFGGGAGGGPMRRRLFRDTFVVQVACGADHTLALGRDGQAWSWGASSGGQLGLGIAGAPVMEPRRIVVRDRPAPPTPRASMPTTTSTATPGITSPANAGVGGVVDGRDRQRAGLRVRSVHCGLHTSFLVLRRDNRVMTMGSGAVSYTHLTLPTIYSV